MSSSKASELQEVADAIRSGDRFLLVTHENPDGDALGSILGMKLALDSLGKDVQMYLAGELDLPREYSFMELGDLRRTLPEDAAERILLALDCANASRTGLDAGADFRNVFHQVYENVAFKKLKLKAPAFERAQVYEGGRLVGSYLLRSDFNELDVGEEYAEGIIDDLRAVAGAELAFMIREPPEPPDAPRRISMRSSRDELDVSAIARKRGGGGHPQAAGFSSDESVEEIVAFIRAEFALASRP